MDFKRGKKTKVTKNKTWKTTKKLTRLKKRKKLRRHVVRAFDNIREAKSAASRNRALHIEEDWIQEREVQLGNESDDDVLPLDMLDADIDWQNSAFAAKVRRIEEGMDKDELETFENKIRRFPGDDGPNVKNLLPIKVGGKLIEQRRVIDADEGDTEERKEENNVEKQPKEDFSNLSATELLKKRNDLIEEAKLSISDCAHSLLANPQQQIHRMKELLKMCVGENVHSLIRESVQKLAVASAAQVFIDIIPGYAIRKPTEEELAQKMKKETRQLRDFEQTLLRNYMKYLQCLEKNVMKLLSKKKDFDETTFSHRFSMLSLKCICRLLIAAPHFNFSTNIISILVRLCSTTYQPAIDECCATLGTVFQEDVLFRISAFGARSIATAVNQKKCAVSPKLIATFLKLNIKDVDKNESSREKERLIGKKFKLAKERKSKTKQKYAKQLKKLEADLKDIEATESLCTKIKYGTEAMKHVFATYFRVIKRMPNTNLLEPVLEGLSKFAHLINVEFFGDIIAALEILVEQKHLRISDSLRCIHAVFVILSGEGIAINVDPLRFYRSMYRILPNIPFEKQLDVMVYDMKLILTSLDLMLIARRKQVSLQRVAAFAKRLIAVSFLLPTACTVAVLAFIRTLFVSHPRLASLTENPEEDFVSSGIFRPDIDDPDCCNALSSSLIAETDVFSKHSNVAVTQFARHLRAGLPSSGNFRLNPQMSAKKPVEWLNSLNSLESQEEIPYFQENILSFAKNQKQQLTSKNLHSIVHRWLESW